MRYLLICSLALFLLCACGGKDTNKDGLNGSSGDKGQSIALDAETIAAQQNAVIGSYVGYFGEAMIDNKITLLINKCENGTVSGRSIVGGNDRPFEGVFKNENGLIKIEANEPGDNRYDGHFSIVADPTTPNTIIGNWKPFQNTTNPKSYRLERKSFVYDQSVGTYPEASQRLLTTADVENMTKSELSYMRNEIFARHGYCFQKKEWRSMFEVDDWYVPNTASIKNLLTPIEKKNIALILRYEEYATDYGDEYGR